MTQPPAPQSIELDVVPGRAFFSSWSGGKDSYLALSRAVAAGGRLSALLTLFCEDGRSTHSHGLPRSLVQRQAESLGVPLVTRAASWDDYEAAFLDALAELRDHLGVAGGVFGDIGLQPHRDWVERVCAIAGLKACLPLWLESRRVLLDELLGAGVVATIVAVDTARLDARFLGRRLDRALVPELEAVGVDACGEEGEFHTLVADAPLFRAPVTCSSWGTFEAETYRFLDLFDDDPTAPAAQCGSRV
jgi:diphthine-ammonia ligase